jgi:hypothetical protein
MDKTIQREARNMSHKTLRLPFAVAAFASVGALALAPTSASAMFHGGFGGGHMMMRGGGGGGGFGGHLMMHRGAGFGGSYSPMKIVKVYPPLPHPHHWHPHWHYGWGVPYYGGVTPVDSTPSYSTPSYVADRRTDSCTCLTKEYLPDNSVLFKDVCTKESALNPANSDQEPAPGQQGYQGGPPQTRMR